MLLAAIVGAGTSTDCARGTVDDNVIFSTELCALLILRIFLLIDGTRRHSYLRFPYTQRRALRNAILNNGRIQSRVGRCRNDKASVFGTGYPECRIGWKSMFGQTRLPLGTIVDTRDTIVNIPIGGTVRQATKSQITRRTRTRVVFFRYFDVGWTCNAETTRLKVGLALVLAQSLLFSILRHSDEFHTFGTGCQIGLIRCTRRLSKESVLGLIIQNLFAKSGVFFFRDATIVGQFILEGRSQNFALNRIALGIRFAMIQNRVDQVGTIQRRLSLLRTRTGLIGG